MITVGALRAASSSSRPAWALRPSASSTSGASIRAASPRASSWAPSAPPKPEPSTTQRPRSHATSASSIAAAARLPFSLGRPHDITSVSFASKIGSRSAGTATVA